MTLHIVPLLDNETVAPQRQTNSLLGFCINSRFRFSKKIGAGTYGLIYLVEDTVTRAHYAAKLILTNLPLPSTLRHERTDQKKYIEQQMFQYFSTHVPLRAQELDLEEIETLGASNPALREIALHLKVHRHPNVVTIHHVALLEDFAVVTFMDYFPQGDLFGNIIDKQLFLSPPPHQDRQLLMKSCMIQLIDAIAFCAAKSVYHCDLKPENIMVRYNPNHRRLPESDSIVDYGELQVCLIDFGLAMTSNLICCNVCRGLSFYMAPERIVNYNTSRLVKSLLNMDEFSTDRKCQTELAAKYLATLPGDVWSLGILFINITCSRNPWPIANINDRHEVFSNYILNNHELLRAILPILRQFNVLLNEIFHLNPNQRISLEALRIRIASCDFFHDRVDYNEQLYTPPEEFQSKAATPYSSVTEMDQCKFQQKAYQCANH